jgi:hypothetical protein
MYKTTDPKIVQEIYNALHFKHSSNQIDITFNYNTKEYTLQISDKPFVSHPIIDIDVTIKVIYGDSVTQDTPLLLQDPDTKMIYIKSISDIYNKNMSINYPEFKLFDKTIRLEKTYSKSHYNVWSKNGWNPIKKVIRHKTNKQIYKVTTDSGMCHVTQDHSLLDTHGNIVKPIDCTMDTILLTGYPKINTLLSNNIISKYTAFAKGIICYEFQEQVPDDILNSNTDIIHSFINGYFYSIKNLQFKNQVLCAGISFLIKKLNYNTLINNKMELFITESKTTGKIQTIELVPNQNDIYVYDLETESGTFNAGIGDIIVKNTDSVFLSMKYNLDNFEKNRKDSFKLGVLCGNKLTKDIFARPPIELEFEKVFQPFILLTKKRYIGKKYEDTSDPFKLKMIDFKGLAILRRDYCQLIKNCYKKIIDIIMNDSADKLLKCIDTYKKTIINIRNYNVPVEDVLMTASIGKSYACKLCRIKSDWIISCDKCKALNPDKLTNCQKCDTKFKCLHTFSLAHINLAQSMLVRREEVVVGDRIPFLFKECNDLKLAKNELAETPNYCKENNIKFNRWCYLEQLAKTILPFFKIVLQELPELLDSTIEYTNQAMIEFGGKKLKASDYKPIED